MFQKRERETERKLTSVGDENEDKTEINASHMVFLACFPKTKLMKYNKGLLLGVTSLETEGKGHRGGEGDLPQ